VIKFDILNRFSGEVQITAEIECDENAARSYKLGLAVKWAIKAKANLSSADLRYADLSSANLSYADLSYADLSSANLSSADLRSANLSYADLRSANLSYADLSSANLSYADLSSADLSSADLRTFKADLWMTLTQNRHEVPALVTALRDGKVNGSTYEGECACLVGTIANAKSVPYATLDHNASNPAEKWFAMIKTGDKPGDDSGGGFASKMALEWAEEFCVLNGIKLDTAAPVEAA
jgi:hypothetical protein